MALGGGRATYLNSTFLTNVNTKVCASVSRYTRVMTIGGICGPASASCDRYCGGFVGTRGGVLWLGGGVLWGEW